MENQQKPGYWAVIPAKVRYDEDLRPNAKLLYAEITALANTEGFCWASNDRMAEWYGISPKTVGSLIQQLARKGYITVELIRDEKQAITGRRIWIDNPGEGVPPILKNEETPLKNEERGVLKNEEYNNTRVKNKPPKAPQGGQREIWDPEMFERFWKLYPKKRDKVKAIREWNRLKADRKLMREMSAALGMQMASEEWQRDNGRAIPYPCRWLSHRRWEDVPEIRTPAAAAPREEATVWL